MLTSKGISTLVRRNVEDYRKAIDYFDQAIEFDPDYALAYAERAEAWTVVGDLTGQRSTAYSKGAKRCRESRRDRAFAGGSARSSRLGPSFCRVEVC